MAWKDFNYVTKGAVAGGLIGLTGSILRLFFLSMNSDPFGIFGIPGAILTVAGVGGCSWKSSSCPIAEFFGYITSIIVFSLIGFVIGCIVRKIKIKK